MKKIIGKFLVSFLVVGFVFGGSNAIIGQNSSSVHASTSSITYSYTMTSSLNPPPWVSVNRTINGVDYHGKVYYVYSSGNTHYYKGTLYKR